MKFILRHCIVAGVAIALCIPVNSIAQSVQVVGTAKISQMSTVSTGSSNVIRQSDGTLAVRKYQVGDFAHGGIVFWVDESGEHGLVVAKVDQSASMRWFAGSLVGTQAKGDGPYAGEMNTAINISSHAGISDDGVLHAARACAELMVTENGFTYGDWYLPSKFELNLIQLNKATIDSTALAHGGAVLVAFTSYWSSTENNDSQAWSQNISSGTQSSTTKSSTLRVRAVRAF